MDKYILFFFVSLAGVTSVASVSEPDYSKGIIFVNEDWYGHQNSTLNYLEQDDEDGNYWQYRIFQKENPGRELGCTNQYGAIWNGRLYLIAKQEKDPGASVIGGRITVADAKTLKLLHQQPEIDPSGTQCDGRGFLGVDEHKGYISSSNGIWVFDLDCYEIRGQVDGSENPNAGGDNDRPNTDPTGSLYHGQSGMMVSAAGKVFAAHQQYGLLIIDPSEDKVTDVISMDIVQEGAGIGSIVKSKDGNLWLSVAKNLQGTGASLNTIVRLNPETLEYEPVELPEEMYGPSNSWYAWTPDAFVASSVQNCLYWKGGPNRWFTGTKIYKYDIDSRSLSLFIDLEKEGAEWQLYGCSIGVHPVTDEIYMSLYHNFGTPTYITRRYSPQGVKIRDYEMISNFWFPSLPLFPEIVSDRNGQPEINGEKSEIMFSEGVLYVRGECGSPIEVYSISGEPVSRMEMTENSGSFRINLIPGIYIVKHSGKSVKIAVR